MPRGTWVFAPNSGGVKIPEAVRTRTAQRLQEYAAAHFAGRYTRLDIRFKGQFCYIDAYTEPDVAGIRRRPSEEETREEIIARLRNTPTHLCRLRYFGADRWGFAFFTYSNEKYELARFPSGDFFGTPEEALEASAVYL